METTQRITYPKIRPVEAKPVSSGGRRAVVLRDPLQIWEKTLVIPADLAPLIGLCDGSREDARDLAAALMVRFGLRISPGMIENFLAALDEACLLQNDRYEEAHRRALETYRNAPFRPPFLAGKSYPASPEDLKRLLDGYLKFGGEGETTLSPPHIAGLISPHIDYERGGPVYGRVWGRAAASVRDAELAVVLGTNHYGADGRLTLTRQQYATPYGVLPTAIEDVDILAAAIGGEEAFAEELNHRTEHSIELAVVWLHHIREGDPCPILPVLCGSFAPFFRRDATLDGDGVFAPFFRTMEHILTRRPTVVIAAADLSHVGPVFGSAPVELRGRALLQEADEELMDLICRVDAAGFLDTVRRTGNRNNVCGVPPIYLALRLLTGTRGETCAYARCPADEQGSSLVSVCGIVFHRDTKTVRIQEA